MQKLQMSERHRHCHRQSQTSHLFCFLFCFLMMMVWTYLFMNAPMHTSHAWDQLEQPFRYVAVIAES